MLSRRRLMQLAAAALPLRARAAGPVPRVLVIGGGPAGISAAIELAERGVAVTLVEAAERLGGKVQGWTVPQGEHTLDVEHGIHGCARGYVHFTELLARFGLEGALREPALWENGVRFGSVETSLHPAQAGELLRRARERAKELGYGAFWPAYRKGQRYIKELTRPYARETWGGLSVTERFETQDVPLTGYRLYPGLYSRSLYFVEPEQLDAGTFAISERFNGYEVRWMRGNPQELLWDPFEEILHRLKVDLRLATPATGLTLEDGRVVGATVGRPGATLELDPPEEGWTTLHHEGMPVFLHRKGEKVRALWGACTHLGCPVARAEVGFACPCHGGRFDDAGWPTAGPPERALTALAVKRLPDGRLRLTLPAQDERLRADAVILAVDAPAFAALAGEALPAARGLKGCAHTVARYWFDRDVDPKARVAVLMDETAHASNGFLLHRTQDRSRAWAEATGGSVIEIQAFRDIPPDAPEDALLDAIEADVRACWPELAEAVVLKRTLARGERFTWFFPGWHTCSTPVETGVPGLLAAGDFVLVDQDCEFMERAVMTGRMAANAVLRQHGMPQAEILTER
ncbi:MAG: FAD-dependent oxidoreductase [Alphaproteobacteria bacterium]|nr:FAD-dependent oxidoreductase [Alphaproteobacteria bacterium]